MHITNITITRMHRSMDGKRITGDVVFRVDAAGKIPAQDMTISCDAPYSNRIRPDAILVGDAIRQVRRLPIIQNGEARLSFASGLRPLAPQSAGMDTLRATG